MLQVGATGIDRYKKIDQVKEEQKSRTYNTHRADVRSKQNVGRKT
jgi:hypothetical protein